MDVIELNEAFAAQALAVTRELGLPTMRRTSIPTAAPSRSAIRSAHPARGSSTTAVNQLRKTGGRYALCTMCIGVGQGIALIIERV